MRKIYALFILSCTTAYSFAQCPTGDITFSTQAAIDAFRDSDCTEITGNVTIRGNDITNLEGLENIKSIGGFLNIRSNNGLLSLRGLENLRSIRGYLIIVYNNQLESLHGLENLISIRGDFYIGYHEQLASLSGLERLENIGGDFYIGYHEQLESLHGLGNITSIRGDLTIDSNSGLLSLSGLDQLESIEGALYITSNAELTDISGLASINPETITDLVILDNTNLTTCNIDAFCEYLAKDEENYPRMISGNAPGCEDEAAVKTVCEEVLGVGDVAMDDYEVKLVPNPVSSGGAVELHTDFPREELKDMKISIFSMSGQLVKEIKSNKEITPIEIGGMNPGVYILHVNTGKHTKSLKLLVK